MARTVREIMNPQVVSLGADSRADEAIEKILAFGITAVPVLAEDGVPIGMTSLRDVVRLGPEKAPMTSPATTIAESASVTAAAETMATTGRHHLVVVGSDGRAVGMVSTLDVIRGLLGRPAVHPATFSTYDEEIDVSWSNEQPLGSSDGLAAIPRAPGVLVFLHSGVGSDGAVAWVEAPDDLAARVRLLAGERPDVPPPLARILSQAPSFRYAVIPDEHARRRAVHRLQDRLSKAPPPGGT